MMVKNPNFAQKSKFCSKIQILLKNQNPTQKSKSCLKIQILLKNLKYYNLSLRAVIALE